MVLKLTNNQLNQALMQVAETLTQQFPLVDVEFHLSEELWGEGHEELSARGFPFPAPDIDAVMKITGDRGEREPAAELALNLVDELREAWNADVDVIANSKVYCRKAQHLAVHSYTPGVPLVPPSKSLLSIDEDRDLIFVCFWNEDAHEHVWGGRVHPRGEGG